MGGDSVRKIDDTRLDKLRRSAGLTVRDAGFLCNVNERTYPSLSP